MAKLPQVRAYMDTKVPTIPPDMPILDAVDYLLEHKVTGAPVVSENGDMVGILTAKDLLRLLSHGDQNEMPTDLVESYMTTGVITVEPRMNIYFVAGVFLTQTFRRLPVVEKGKLVGAITRFDILRAIKANLR